MSIGKYLITISAFAFVGGCHQPESPPLADTLNKDQTAAPASPSRDSSAQKVSSFGKYQGYSEADFDGVIRESRYVAVADGTRMALDIFHPTRNGSKSPNPLPVALQVTRYWRGFENKNGTLKTGVGEFPSGANTLQFGNPISPESLDQSVNTHRELLRHGYVVVVMDSRGTGASFGVQSPGLSLETQDMKEIIDWIAAQSWSTDKVGMFGGSWLGVIQFFAALGKPEPLAAIFPAVPNFLDFYRIGNARGAYIKGAMLTMRKTLVGLSEVENEGQAEKGRRASAFGNNIAAPPRVDEDPEGVLRGEARAGQGSASFAGYIDRVLSHPAVAQAVERLSLDSPDQVIDTLFHADALNEALQGHPDLREALSAAQWPQPEESLAPIASMLGDINAAAIPTYLWDGWQDPMPNERILWYYNLDMPRRLTVGPWSHGPDEPDDPSALAYNRLMTTEILRWFDHWLKGIDNGVTDEDPVVFAVMQNKNEWEWKQGPDFPPADAKPTRFYFTSGPSASITSINDGSLSLQVPAGQGEKDDYTVDYTANSGEHTRYHDATGGGPIVYGDFAPNDAKGLTYTTAPLDEDMVTAGFPQITLYAQATVSDPVFVVHLEEVTPDGYSTMISQGSIRASHRTPWNPPYQTEGIPWTSSLEKDVLAAPPLTLGPEKISYALEPVANRWDKGNRIRVSIFNADETVMWVIPQEPPPVISMWRDAAYPSHIQLHVVDD